MPSKKKKLARQISADTGHSHEGAMNVMAAALRGEDWAVEIVAAAKKKTGAKTDDQQE